MNKIIKFLHLKKTSAINHIYILFFLAFLILLILSLVINHFSSNKTFVLISVLIITFFLLFALARLFIALYIFPIKQASRQIKSLNEGKFEESTKTYYNIEYEQLKENINTISKENKQILNDLNAQYKKSIKYNKELERDVANKKYLVQNISHEIKTPLAVIAATASGIIDDIFPPEDTKKELKTVMDEVEKTSEMLQEIVQIYKIEGQNYKLDIASIDFKVLLEKSIDELKTLALKYQQTLKIDMPDNIVVSTDEKAIKKVVNNVFVNAITYSPENQTVEINVKEFKTEYVFEVINYGVMIPPEKIGNVFEPFFRVEESRNKKEDHGNGLGLYLVYEMLNKLGHDFGILNVQNGVKFYIVFNK